jgi:hypothetical protein
MAFITYQLLALYSLCVILAGGLFYPVGYSNSAEPPSHFRVCFGLPNFRSHPPLYFPCHLYQIVLVFGRTWGSYKRWLVTLFQTNADPEVEIRWVSTRAEMTSMLMGCPAPIRAQRNPRRNMVDLTLRTSLTIAYWSEGRTSTVPLRANFSWLNEIFA